VSGRNTPPPSVHQLKVTLAQVRPPVWRRIQVASDVTLARLHRVLQVAMGWENRHREKINVSLRRMR
jgi:hypothetical protein